ncbi:hypothetical protein NF865_07065 [Thermococcus aggregans]|uniref:Uncharacterized protein n=1 Tax=Thermococcus aggregans TaxID=110163 RepID=A0A9E7MWC1_THEAG|nr:hypothetical protein [Thermococcus aggregans]USS40095.1 hypothetical protein NF865_07065 [Thermococcus aggregans]
MNRLVLVVILALLILPAYYAIRESSNTDNSQPWDENDLALWRVKIERLAANSSYGIGAIWLGKDSLARDNYIHIAISPYGDKKALMKAIEELGIPPEAVKIEVRGEYDEDFTAPEPACPINYTHTRAGAINGEVIIHTSFGTSGMYYLKLLACEEEGSELKLTFKLWKCNPASVMCTDDLTFPKFEIKFLKDYQRVKVTVLADSWKGKRTGVYTFDLSYKPLWVLYEDSEKREEMYIYRDGWVRVLYAAPSKEALEVIGNPYVYLYPWELLEKYGHNWTKLNQEILAIAKEKGYLAEEKEHLVFVYVPNFTRETLQKVEEDFGEYVQAIVLRNE